MLLQHSYMWNYKHLVRGVIDRSSSSFSVAVIIHCWPFLLYKSLIMLLWNISVLFLAHFWPPSMVSIGILYPVHITNPFSKYSIVQNRLCLPYYITMAFIAIFFDTGDGGQKGDVNGPCRTVAAVWKVGSFLTCPALMFLSFGGAIFIHILV